MLGNPVFSDAEVERSWVEYHEEMIALSDVTNDCPFCGHTAEVVDMMQGWRVVCYNWRCNVRGPRRTQPINAVIAWNKRVGG